MIPLDYNLQNLMVRKTTTAAAVFGLGLVVFVLASVLMMANGLKKTLGRGGNKDVAVVLRKGSDAELSSVIEQESTGLVLAQSTFQPAAGPPGIAEIVVVILLDKVGAAGMSNVTVRGMPDGGFAFRPNAKLTQGRMPAAPDEVLAGQAIIGRFKGLAIGQAIDLKKNRPVKIVGVFSEGESSSESEIWAEQDTVRRTFGREGYFSSVRVRLESPEKFAGFKAAVEENRTLALVATREPEFFEKQSEGLALFLSFIGLLVAFFVSLGATVGAMITMYTQVATRQRELGTLRALGFTGPQILFSLLIESVMLALAGGVLGGVAALAMSFVRISMVNMTSWSEIVFKFEATPGIILGAMAAAGVMGILGGIFPAIRAARMSPSDAMRA